MPRTPKEPETMETHDGPSVASPGLRPGWWVIRDPWGDQVFHGTRTQVRSEMRRRESLNTPREQAETEGL